MAGVFLVALALLRVSAGLLNVHICAHTHDDVGWTKTPDGYYNDQVQYILTNTVNMLLANDTRRFTYVEIYYFARWWAQQNDSVKDSVRTLVSQNRLEFTLGGWCMHDEATTHYEQQIDQMTQGHQFLLDTFAVRPTIGWQIDPFGHSSTNAALFAAMGLNAIFGQKIDFQQWNHLATTKTLESIWRPSASLTNTSDLFTHILYDNTNGYGYEFPTVVDDPNQSGYNVDTVSKDFYNNVMKRRSLYSTDEVVFLYGNDFAFQDAATQFPNIEKVMRYVNNRPDQFNISMFYSSPSRYISALHNLNLAWPLNTYDYFPCVFSTHYVRTGFYSTRPLEKGYDRACQASYKAARQLHTLAHTSNWANQLTNITSLWNALGVHQHHDAMPGTDYENVAQEYINLMYKGAVDTLATMSDLVTGLTGGSVSAGNNLSPCVQSNVSICPQTTILSQTRSVHVLVYNSLSWTRTEVVAVPVPIANVAVVDSSNNTSVPVPFQVHPVFLPPGIKPGSQTQPYTLYFQASDIPALGFKVFTINPTTESSLSDSKLIAEAGADVVLENDYLSLNISSATGRLTSVTDKERSVQIGCNQDILYYEPNPGDSTSGSCSSGYGFRPKGTSPLSFNSNPATVSVVQGPLFQEVRQVFDSNSGIAQQIRLYSADKTVELVNWIGPLDISNNLGREPIVRFSTSLQTNNRWWTDSNSYLELQPRWLNSKPNYNVTVYEPVSTNYYPVTSVVSIQDSNNFLGVVVDRARGGSSQGTGQVEFMLGRRIINECNEDASYKQMNDSTVVGSTSRFFLTTPTGAASQYRSLSLRLAHPVQVFYGSTPALPNKFYEGLATTLPPNLQILTLQTLQSGKVLLRLQHLYAAGEDATLSQPVTFDLATLFPHPISGVTEMSVTGNQPLSSMNRLVWKIVTEKPSDQGESGKGSGKGPNAPVVTFGPMQIRTFLIETFWN